MEEARRAGDANAALKEKPAGASQKLGTFSGVCGVFWGNDPGADHAVVGMGSDYAERSEHFDVLEVRVPTWTGWSVGGTCATCDKVYPGP